MSRLSIRYRIAGLCLALLQFALQGALVVMDGYESAKGRPFAAVHVEATSTHHGHVHTDDCVTGQFFAHGGALPQGNLLGYLPAWKPVQLAIAAERPVYRDSAGAPALPRAPPAFTV